MERQLVSAGDDDGTREAEQVGIAPPEATEEGGDFLSLPAFRMMCLSNPLLDTFFSSQLPASFQLEPAHRASIQGTSIWHDIPAASVPGPASSTSSSTLGSPRVPQGHAPSSAPAGTTSFPSSIQSSPSSARAYSKDISTGVVGRLGGFLNTFLGEDIKSKVDELADTIGEKLNTKVVKGPLPSFANLDVNGTTGRRESSSGTLGMDDLSAMEEQRRARRKRREEEEQQEEEEAKLAEEKRGIDVQAAQKSLRMATESIVEGTQTGGKQFKEDVPVVAGAEEDEEDDVVGEEDIHA